MGGEPGRSATIGAIFGLAALLRLVLVAVAELQDRLAEVPYTDVDYRVFSEAAESVALGLSPYSGRTELLREDATRYRYTPLLAYLLVPNIWFHRTWGKLLFSGLDLAAGRVLLIWLRAHAGGDFGTICAGVCLWLFNPFCFTIATRGSGESVVILMIYGCFAALHMRRDVPLAAVLFGLATHWRLYPVVFALPILLGLGAGRPGFWQLVHGRGVQLAGISAGVFVALAALFHALYGIDFIMETYLHHGRRLDPQHNFSVYFYPTALHLEDPTGKFPNLARFAFLPQLAACAWLGWKEARHGPVVAPLLQVIALVATNKVITAQYFVWWWALLPLALPWLSWRRWRLGGAILIWAAAEVHWLLWAYLLEFRRLPVRPMVWFASCIFFGAHLALIWELQVSARLATASRESATAKNA
mmetsp:Transcript_8911/g.23137  ORF Transcript_8911/g.23137 Transcript_8911/m.23137 type:complete len:416 (-) Transcript_8911:28-1275(-)